MSLKSEIAQLVAGGQQLHGDELVRLSEKYGVDTQEVAFIFEVAEQGRLDDLKGVD